VRFEAGLRLSGNRSAHAAQVAQLLGKSTSKAKPFTDSREYWVAADLCVPDDGVPADPSTARPDAWTRNTQHIYSQRNIATSKNAACNRPPRCGRFLQGANGTNKQTNHREQTNNPRGGRRSAGRSERASPLGGLPVPHPRCGPASPARTCEGASVPCVAVSARCESPFPPHLRTA
jgi:hypothetical protein